MAMEGRELGPFPRRWESLIVWSSETVREGKQPWRCPVGMFLWMCTMPAESRLIASLWEADVPPYGPT